MSARDSLLSYLRQAGLSTPRAEANLDAFAHELAEKQRQHHNGGGGCELGICHGDELPDLIDPKVPTPGA